MELYQWKISINDRVSIYFLFSHENNWFWRAFSSFFVFHWFLQDLDAVLNNRVFYHIVVWGHWFLECCRKQSCKTFRLTHIACRFPKELMFDFECWNFENEYPEYSLQKKAEALVLTPSAKQTRYQLPIHSAVFPNGGTQCQECCVICEIFWMWDPLKQEQRTGIDLHSTVPWNRSLKSNLRRLSRRKTVGVLKILAGVLAAWRTRRLSSFIAICL